MIFIITKNILINMQPETERSSSKQVDLCIKTENSDGFLENLANAYLSPKEAQEKIGLMIEALASKNWRDAEAQGNSKLKDQADNLRRLAKIVWGFKSSTL